MGDFNCTDINGISITQFVFNDNGTVLGIISTGSTGENPNNDPTETTYELTPAYEGLLGTSLSPISQNCCNALNFIWESSTNTCYWSETCDQGPDFKIVLGAKGNDGALFQVDNNENCHLEVEFDYLFQFDCDTILNCVGNNDNSDVNCLTFFERLDINVTIDKLTPRDSIEDVSYVDNMMLTTIYESELFKVDNIVDYFTNNCNTGLLVTGNTICLNQMNECIITNLSADCSVFSACTLDSNWLHHKIVISDEETLSAITNEKIKLGFLIKNSDCDFSILIDRIEINKVCTSIDKQDIYVTKCPSFDIERIIDNKKSWISSESVQERDFLLSMRETDYSINHHKLSINTKEIDLDISPANAIETDVWCYIKDNNDLLNCSTGTTTVFDCNTCISGYCGDVNLNIDNLLTTDFSAITSVDEFIHTITTELIDVKSRKTITSYPTLKALYERYAKAYQGLPQSSAFNYDKMDKFMTLIGDYWIDLIEQVIPSTTIWGSTKIFKNTVFDNNKFKYKKYSLFTCIDTPTSIIYPSPTIGIDSNVEVLITNISETDFSSPNCLISTGETTNCYGVMIKQIDDGSEFIGTVSIIGDSSQLVQSGNTDNIIINECTLSIINITTTNVSTIGGTDGSAIVNITGANGPVEYLWSNGETTQSINNLSSGNYTITVIDTSNNCIDTLSVIINEPN